MRDRREWYSLQWPVRGTFFRLQVYERVRISLAEVHEKLEISVIGPKGLTDKQIFKGQTSWLSDLFIYLFIKCSAFTAV